MREALGGLTRRGRALLAAGLVGVAVSLVTGVRALLPVGALLVVLPLLAAASVATTRYRLTCARVLSGGRAPVGSTIDVELTVENLSTLPSTGLVITDTVPAVLGVAPAMTLASLPPHACRRLYYPLNGLARGRYLLGPVGVGVRDPFGLCLLTRVLPVHDTVVLTPAVERLGGLTATDRWGGRGTTRARAVAVVGEDDVATRPWRQGDDQRRIHWRATARTGQLMVRGEEQPWQAQADVVLDNRRAAHRGRRPTDSLEWAVSAAASFATSLLAQGGVLRVWTVDGPLPTEAGSALADGAGPIGTTAPDCLLDALVDVAPTPTDRLTGVLSQLRATDADGLLVVVLGASDAVLIDELIRTPRRRGLAVLMDVDSWAPPPGGGGAPQTTAEVGAEAAAAVLATAGWRTLVARRGDRLSALWAGAQQETWT